MKCAITIIVDVPEDTVVHLSQSDEDIEQNRTMKLDVSNAEQIKKAVELDPYFLDSLMEGPFEVEVVLP